MPVSADLPPRTAQSSAGRQGLPRWSLLALWVLVCLFAVGCFLWPIASLLTRSLLMASLGAAWVGALALWWRRRRFRAALLLLTGLVAAWLCLPGRPPAPASLRAEYVRRLHSYEGTRYVWGGENRLEPI